MRSFLTRLVRQYDGKRANASLQGPPLLGVLVQQLLTSCACAAGAQGCCD